MPEDRYEEWAGEKRAELRRSYLALLVELAGLYEEREEYGPAMEALQKVVVEEPAHEEAQVGLMRLYATSDQRHEALLQYERLRVALSRELGTEPTAASRHLYEEIRGGWFSGAHPPLVYDWSPRAPYGTTCRFP